VSESTNTSQDIFLPTIVGLEACWNMGLGNFPEVLVAVDEAWFEPSPYGGWPHRLLKSFKSDRSDDHGRLYIATQGIWAHFVLDDTRTGETRHTQFRGACDGKLLLENDEVVNVASGWSSSTITVNRELPEEDHLTEVTLRNIQQVKGGKRWTIGRAGIAIRVDALREAMREHLPDVHLVRTDSLGGPYYVPSVREDRVEKPDGQQMGPVYRA
jgi:hypothetical protein